MDRIRIIGARFLVSSGIRRHPRIPRQTQSSRARTNGKMGSRYLATKKWKTKRFQFIIKLDAVRCFVLCPDIGESMYGPGVSSRASQGVTHPRFRIAGVKPQPVSLRQPGVARSSPSTLTTSLATPGPSSSSSNRPSN